MAGFKWKFFFQMCIQEQKKKNSPNIARLRSFVVKEKPPSQRTIAKSLKCLVSLINEFINTELNFKITQCRTRCENTL